ncbi:hypothetical protein N9383_03000, partial [Granulosicoccus sp.]|nr:hypothetical protein [Granulosicoccus sp.]
MVLSKFPPLRAAMVSPTARRHPVDSNSLIVRGLPFPIEVWLTLCLNRQEYERLLLIESGVLRRISIRTLSNLRIPPAPEEMIALASSLREILDETVLVEEDLHRVKVEAAQVSLASSGTDDFQHGGFYNTSTMSNDSWLPSSTFLGAKQAILADEFGWKPIDKLAHTAPRRRLKIVPSESSRLQLSDIAEDLFVAAPADRSNSDSMNTTRTLDKPLTAGDVLLSTLGTSFRTAYVDEDIPANTFISDGWVRLRFRETPAAWALLLTTPEARDQTKRLAIGSAQQFVPPDALLGVHVPTPDRKTRDRWQRILVRHHAK